ncbi:hypothetical protein G4Y79_22255 [Phototrophicus methaneseepsis]|uniref:Membrane protein 6-pyruvoyl-tetrahydropterin synthase-related domain-containing protein n=1 Tax=Phototrophicus methaneseepsis TaxID=2710758 RepID=A0A7S8E8K7_9CHLR|nr:6-pyruvoyl-tetrahydropterin synthase-related protein [Phototrophicus methaneseepsis]QPC82374.1 hypothetical protein G4Y79_22255 [Phototrophicus methaneseepsis]
MKWLSSRLDFGLLLVLLLSCFAALPLILHPQGLPNGADVLYHTYRAALMDRSWALSDLFPRWADVLYYGYGAPLWHFYAPLSYYLTSLLSGLFAVDALGALRILIIICNLSAGVGMYDFSKRLSGRLGGVLAALAYLFAPYILFTLPYARGAYPELLALALFPWVMWRFTLLQTTRSRRDTALAALCLFLVIMAHNLMAVVLTLFLLAYILWHMVTAQIVTPRKQWRIAIYPYTLSVLAVALAVGLSAYFWLPVLLEAGTVHLQNLTAVDQLNYQNFFVWGDVLFGLVPLQDAGAINALRPVTVLGLPQWVLALSGFVGSIVVIVRVWRAGERPILTLSQSLFFGFCALICMVLVLPLSASIWQGLTPLQYLQFPWRLLGPAAFSLAVLVGMNAHWLQKVARPNWQMGLAAAATALILLLAAPLFTVLQWRYETLNTSVGAYLDSEQDGVQLGTTFTDEYRPADVSTLPGPQPALIDDYRDGYPVDRAHAPDGVDIFARDSGPTSNVWDTRADEAFTLEVYTFYWPGWVASVDGGQVPITPSPNHGFITFEVPAGQHTVSVNLTATMPRLFGNLISILTIIAFFACLRFLPAGVPVDRVPQVTQRQAFGVLIGGAVALVGVLLFMPEPSVLWLNTEPGRAPARTEVRYTFSDEEGELARVTGYDLGRTTFAPGDTVRLAVYWQGRRDDIAINYSSFVHIGEPEVPPLAQVDKLHPGGYAMSEWWSPEEYIYDEYEIKLPADMPAGDYTVFVGLYTCALAPAGDCGNGYRPQVTDTEGQSVGDTLPLTTISVR